MRSVSTKIALAFFFASALPVIVGMLVINTHAYERAHKTANTKLEEIALSRERLLTSHIENILRSADTVSGMPSIRAFVEAEDSGAAPDPSMLVSAAQDLASVQCSMWGDTHHIFLTDTTGRVILSPPSEGWDREGLTAEQVAASQGVHFGQSISDAEFFAQALEEPTLSGFFDFVERDHYHQLAMHPVRSEHGDTIGLIVIEIAIDTTAQILTENFRLGETGRVFLTTNTGERVVHLKSEHAPIGELPEGISRAIVEGTLVSGRFEHGDADVMGAYLPSGTFPWVVCIESDYAESMGDTLAQQSNFVSVAAIVLALCAVSALAVARAFGSPISALVDDAGAVASGDLSREIRINRDDELGLLQRAVDEMRSSLKHQIDELDKTVIDRTEQLVELNEQLRNDAERDRLTGLANRDLFHRRLESDIECYHEDNERRFAVLFFDFDRFKLVNDSLGHSTGDALLCSIARRFRENLRSTDMAARFGGDEFVVALSPLESNAQAKEAAQRLLREFERPHLIDGHEITSTASIGMLFADERYKNADDMIRDADAAMYQAKVEGKCRVVGFDERMHEDAKRRLRLQEDLYRAVECDQLRLAYQPIVDLETLENTGFEALIRWEHPEFGFVGPDQFIDIAEDTGQIVPIGQWVIERAVRDILDWNARFSGADQLSVNVNVSKRQLIDESFMPHLRGVLRKSGIDPAQLKIELTESTIVDPRSSDSMGDLFDEIRAMGVKIAMDDFGTGHSSLGLLHKYRFDVLKIDQSFIREMDLNRDIGAVLHAIIDLAQNSGMSIVAEGVETESQVTALIAHGCDMVQGYYFAKPMFFDDVLAYLGSPPGETRRAA